MATVVTRLLVIAALMLMPLGMTHADAMSTGSEATQETGHCSDMTNANDDADNERGMVDCDAMCSAVPASGEGVTQSRVIRAPLLIGAMIPFAGLSAEIATPPPRA